MPQRTYTPTDIADATGRHPESIRRNLRQSELRGTKMGNEWVVTPAALREWLGDELFDVYFGDDEADADGSRDTAEDPK